jgi:dihydrofolate synthase/folylpolyglutamate synthase
MARPGESWIESLDPWPHDGFGLERMQRVLEALGHPEAAYPAIHVVGSKGKGTTTRTIEETLLAEGLYVGAYYSPHVTGWPERIRVGGAEADFERAIARIRAVCERLGATQFEALTAAALAEFEAAHVDVAVVEAGLGGRFDATNVLHSPVQVLTNVALEHTAVLGQTREAIAAEKLAVVQQRATVVVGEPEWESLARQNGASRVVVETGGNIALAEAAVEAFLGRRVEAVPASLPGRLEWRGQEIWDGAHTPEAIRYVGRRLPRIGSAVVSILDDKDVAGVLGELAALVQKLVVTRSTNPRALPAHELADQARPLFRVVEVEQEPVRAVARAHELGSPVLVTGSFSLLADLARSPGNERSEPACHSKA